MKNIKFDWFVSKNPVLKRLWLFSWKKRYFLLVSLSNFNIFPFPFIFVISKSMRFFWAIAFEIWWFFNFFAFLKHDYFGLYLPKKKEEKKSTSTDHVLHTHTGPIGPVYKSESNDSIFWNADGKHRLMFWATWFIYVYLIYGYNEGHNSVIIQDPKDSLNHLDPDSIIDFTVPVPCMLTRFVYDILKLWLFISE